MESVFSNSDRDGFVTCILEQDARKILEEKDWVGKKYIPMILPPFSTTRSSERTKLSAILPESSHGNLRR